MPQDQDYLMALEMQKRLIDEDDDSDIDIVEFKKPSALIEVSKNPLKIRHSNAEDDDDFLNRTQNLVHPQWETLDPTPDIYALFGQFDGKFFQSRLKCVTLEWSKRMYSCAGICYSKRNGYGMEVTIRLSEPLLKLRPRKDLIETLLHEMIHAYCFVLNIREGNGGHGPNFKKIMGAINKVAGTNITVYHTFHDEVNLYKQHWWRCNGVCQDRGPFFGYVKRSSNRAPGPSDNWFAGHQRSCGGTFMKIKGPEKPEKKKKEKENTTGKKGNENGVKSLVAAGDLRKFFTPKISNGSSGPMGNIKGFGATNNGFKGPVKTNGGGTMLLNPKTKSNPKISSSSTSDIAKAFPPSSYPGMSSDPFNVDLNKSSSGNRNKQNSKNPPTPVGNLRNVVGFKDIGGLGGGGGCDNGGGGGNSGRAVSGVKTSSSSIDWGRGNSLTSNSYSSGNTSLDSSPEGDVDRKHLRDLWSKRFGGGDNSNKWSWGDKRMSKDKVEGDAKRRRVSQESFSTSNKIDTDIIYISDKTTKKDSGVITILSDDDESDDNEKQEDNKFKAKINKNMTIDERQTMIKQEIIDESINLLDDDIELIDDEYDDNISLTTAAELADTSIIDEFFGDDTLMADFKRENDSKPSTSSRSQNDPDEDIITCFICESKMARKEYAEHLNGCEGISKKIQPPKSALKKLSKISADAKPDRPRGSSARDILRSAGYTEDVLAQISSTDEADTDEEDFLNSSGVGHSNMGFEVSPATNGSTIECPVCKKQVNESRINEHLDECLST